MPLNTESSHSSHQQFDDLRQRFHDDEVNYQILRGDRQGVKGKSGEWDTDFTLERYTAATDYTIGLLDGSIEQRDIVDPRSPERSHEQPDTVVWLDKSARPVQWFVDAFWDQFAQEGATRPTDEFLNIDRINWFVQQGHMPEIAATRLGPYDFDISKVSEDKFARLRALFVIGELSEDNWQEEVWKLPTRLDGKNVLIMDEVRNKGGTLAIATQVLRKAIPEATISGDYFWPSHFYSVGKTSAESVDQQMVSAPVWYSNEDSFGRGVGDIDHDYYDHLYEKEPTQENLRKKIGAFVISAPHFNKVTYETVKDEAADKLKQDIAYLSYATADGKVLRTPSAKRDDDQAIAIIEQQGLGPRTYRDYREQRSRQPNTNK